MKMIISLNLTTHCIQTEIKRQYNKLISDYFKSDPDRDKDIIEAKIDLLQNALKNLDFGRLRSTYPELSGGRSDEIALTTGPENQLTILINGRPLK